MKAPLGDRWRLCARGLCFSLTLAALSLLCERPSWAAWIDFSYRDQQLLLPGQSQGARIWIPEGGRRGRTLTLVVLLHGLNKKQRMFPLFGGIESVDVPGVAQGLLREGRVRPDFVLAGPTQTAGAETSSTLWRHFDLPDFVRAVRRRLPRGVRIAERVVVMGHSGAGCSSAGGLWWIASRYGNHLRALATMDTCMDAAFGRHLHRYLWRPERNQRVWLLNFWQSGWERPVADFEAALELERMQEDAPRGLHDLARSPRRWLSARVDGLGHDRIVGRIFEEALLRLFPSDATLKMLEAELAGAQRAQRALRREAARARRAAARARAAAARKGRRAVPAR